MEIDTILGLPAHPLIVHAVVVLVPLAAVGGLAIAVSPWVRRHIGWLVVALAALTVVLVPLATGSGESLEERVGESQLLEEHAELGEQLLPWVIGLALGAAALMLIARLRSRRQDDPAESVWTARWLSFAVAAVVVVAASGALVEVALIGHSGAKATWSDVGAGGSGGSGEAGEGGED